MRTHITFFSHVFVAFLFICLFEVGHKVSVVSATEVIPCLPDLDGDGVVNILDLAMWAGSWNAHAGDPNWNSAADFNCDNVVDVRDAVIMLEDFGKSCRFYDFNDLSWWNVSSGSWSVQNGALEGSSSQDGVIYVGDAAWKDSTFTAALKIAGDSAYTEATVAFLGGPTSFYYAGLGCWGHRVSISTRVGGVWRELAFSGDVADIERDVWYVLAVKVADGTIMLYLDGSLELSVNDSTFLSGCVGIGIWNSHVIVDYVTTIGTIDPTNNTHSSSNVNLAVIPYDPSLPFANGWGDYHGGINYGVGPQIVFLDHNIVRTTGKPSIRLEPHVEGVDINHACECDGAWYSCKAGDHIVAKIWIRTDPSTPQENADPYHGARLGMDLYAPKGDGTICIVDSYPHEGREHIASMVMFDTPQWTLRTWDIIVPDTVYTQNVNNVPIPPTQVASFVIWVQMMHVQGVTANSWFADAELYINPT